jgi:hypothetical protein
MVPLPHTVEQIQKLHQARVSTPEICRLTGVSSEVVLAILIDEYQRPATPKIARQKRRVGRPPIDWSSIMTDVVTILCREPYSAPLWTIDSLLEALAHTSGHLLARSTVLRRLREHGVSFDGVTTQLSFNDSMYAKATALRKIKRGNLYALLEIRSRDYESIDDTVSGLLAIRADNFMLCLLKEKRNLTSQFYKEFLLRLLNYHTGRHVIVLYPPGGQARQDYLSSFACYYRRLHLVSATTPEIFGKNYTI